MTIQLKNNAVGYLGTAINASDTGAVLQTGDGANFPALAGADYFYATLESSGGTMEIVKVTARSGDSMTIVRAQESTTANSFAAGSRVELRVTAQALVDVTASYNDAASITYRPPFTGGVQTNVEAKLAQTVSVEDFGASPSSTRAANNVAFQAAFDYLRDLEKGGTIVIPAGEYDLSASLTLLANTEMDARAWVIEGNGATLNWANSGLVTGAALEVGAEGGNFAYRESSFIAIRNLRIVGPETQNVCVSGGVVHPTPDTSTTGLVLSSALNVVLDNIFIRRFYRGIAADRCWPITANAVNCSANYIGIQLGSYCTLGQWTGCSVETAVHCLVLQPDATDGGIGSQTFTGMRFENSLRGVTLDQGVSSTGGVQIQAITFTAPRFEQIAYDLFRMGQVWSYANVSTAGADRDMAFCQTVNIYGGEWSDPTVSGYCVRASANGYVRGCDLALPVGYAAKIAGAIILSRIFIQPGPSGGTDSGKVYFPQGSPVIFGNEIQFSTNDGRVDFQGITSSSGGQTTSRKLGDYEQGTWVPAYVPEVNAFTGITYDTGQTFGRYTKIGSQVFIMGMIRTDALTIGSATGNLYIGNLPYTTSDVNFPVTISIADAFASNPPTSGYVRATTKLISCLPTQVLDMGTGANANELLFSATYLV